MNGAMLIAGTLLLQRLEMNPVLAMAVVMITNSVLCVRVGEAQAAAAAVRPHRRAEGRPLDSGNGINGISGLLKKLDKKNKIM